MDLSELSSKIAIAFSQPRIGRSNVILTVAMNVAQVIANNSPYKIMPLLDIHPDDAWTANKKRFLTQSDVTLMLIKLLPFTTAMQGTASYVRTDTLVIDLIMKHYNVSEDFEQSSYYKFKEIEELVQEGFELSGCKWFYGGYPVCQYRSSLTSNTENNANVMYSDVLCHFSRLTSTLTEAYDVTKESVAL